METFEDTFGAWFKRLRLQRGLTQRDISDAMGIHQQTVSTWENNRRAPERHDTIVKIAETLEVTSDEVSNRADAQRARTSALATPLSDTPVSSTEVAVTLAAIRSLLEDSLAKVDLLSSRVHLAPDRLAQVSADATRLSAAADRAAAQQRRAAP